jgi:cytosine/adenosine deaminase-related metal-dependent hydrolase
MADRFNTGMTAHLSSTPDNVAYYLEETGKRPLEHFDDLGILGPNLLLSHLVHLGEAEIEIALERQVHVAHCPSTSLYFGYGLTGASRFPEMLDRGAVIGLGCDDSMAGHYLDLVRAMYASLGLFRDARQDPSCMTPERMLEMATIGGARACLREGQVGSLEPGKRADVTIFDTGRIEWQPLFDPVQNLVLSADGHSVDTVLIDGKVVLRGGHSTVVNEDELIRELQSVAGSAARQFGLDPKPLWPVIR